MVKVRIMSTHSYLELRYCADRPGQVVTWSFIGIIASSSALAQQHKQGQGGLIAEVSRSHAIVHRSRWDPSRQVIGSTQRQDILTRDSPLCI
jgi:hypothetical protein